MFSEDLTLPIFYKPKVFRRKGTLNYKRIVKVKRRCLTQKSERK